MTMREVTIEVDIPDNVEVVAWRPPKKGEKYLDAEGVKTATYDFMTATCLIVRDKWVWPPWLNGDKLEPYGVLRRNSWHLTSGTDSHYLYGDLINGLPTDRTKVYYRDGRVEDVV